MNKAASEGHIIKDIDVNGTEVLKNVLKDIKVVTIFLKVPKDELRRRLESRADKPSKEEIDLRLGDGLKIAEASEYDTIVIAGMGFYTIVDILSESKKLKNAIDNYD